MSSKKNFQLNWIDTYGVPDKDREESGTADKTPPGNKKRRANKKRTVKTQTAKNRTTKNRGMKKQEAAPFAKAPWTEKPVDVELDLHGMYIDEALAEVEHHLKVLAKSRGGWLRVIHGQPRRDPFSIYAQVRQNLNARWKKWIHHHYQESHNTGATLVQVRPDEPKTKPGKSKPKKKRL